MNCHSLHGTGGTFGPALDTIGRTLTKEQIERYIRDPRAVNPKAMMPPQKELSDKEREEVAAFLANLK
jgi:nitric oxide reductase subunit C